MSEIGNITRDTLTRAAIPERDPYARLAAAVLIAAYKDAVDESASARRSAAKFFTRRLFTAWADVARVDYDVVEAGYHNVIAHGFPVTDGRQRRYAG